MIPSEHFTSNRFSVGTTFLRGKKKNLQRSGDEIICSVVSGVAGSSAGMAVLVTSIGIGSSCFFGSCGAKTRERGTSSYSMILPLVLLFIFDMIHQTAANCALGSWKKALITTGNRRYTTMYGGWGPHLRGLMRENSTSLWFFHDSGQSPQPDSFPS